MDKKEIFRLLLEYLNRTHIAYALTGSDSLLAQEDGTANIIISSKDFRSISRRIKEFSKQSNFIPVQKLHDEATACLFILCHYHQQTKKAIYFKVNFQSDYISKGRFYLSAKELLSNRTYFTEQGKWQLNDSYSFIYLLIRSIDQESIDQTSFFHLLHYWSREHAYITKNLKRFFTEESIDIITYSFNDKEAKYLDRNLNFLKKDLRSNARRRVQDAIKNKISRLRCLIKPSGLVVGVLGRDGSGKSAFVSEITGALGTYFKNTTSFKKCPAILYKGAIFNKNEGYHFSKPHLYSKRNTFQSFLKLNLLLIEFMLGYWLKIFPLKVKSHLVLYDRYFIDVLADPLRYRIKNNKIFIKVIHYILPKPDLWIILDLPSHILLQRKQELTYEMAEALRYEYLKLEQLLPNSIVINNEEEIKRTVNKAAVFIFKYMQQKVAV